jgi:hypothetical protein
MAEQIRVSRTESIRNLILISLTAGIPRVIGAFFLRKEPFGDAYCYIEQAAVMKGKIVAGTFSINDLSGFWLPLYQFVCALIFVVVHPAGFASKLVSAVAGIGVCILVYLCTHVLTASQRISLVAALAIALNPFHLEYSASAMTDVPHAVLVMACMYFVLKERWTLAACLGAAAAFTRLDSWLLVALLPAIQLMRQRKVPILTILILSLAPALWLFICWKASGDALSSFHAHDQYVLARLAAHPEHYHLSLKHMKMDAYRLIYSVNLAVLVGCFAGLWFVFRDWRKRLNELLRIPDLLVCLLFFFAYLSFIVSAYLTKNQSDIWDRYGLIMFSLGLPVLAYSAQQIFSQSSVLAKAALGIVLVLGLAQYGIQAADLAHFVANKPRNEIIANYLRQQYASDPTMKIFCDSPEVRVMSGIPRSQFFESRDAPRDKQGFLEFLRAKGVKFLEIPEESETSTPSQLFPGLVRESGDTLEGTIPAPDDKRIDSLYKVRPQQ